MFAFTSCLMYLIYICVCIYMRVANAHGYVGGSPQAIRLRLAC